jgi:hypothetical protein
MQRLPRANLSSNALGLTVPHGLLVLADEVIDPFVAFKRVTISVAIGGIAEMPPTSEPTRMTQTVGKAWSRRPRPQTGGAQPPVLLRLSPVRSSSRAITAPFAGCRRFSPQCWCIRKNRDSSCRNDRHHRYVGKVATARERLRKDYESAPKRVFGCLAQPQCRP